MWHALSALKYIYLHPYATIFDLEEKSRRNRFFMASLFMASNVNEHIVPANMSKYIWKPHKKYTQISPKKKIRFVAQRFRASTNYEIRQNAWGETLETEFSPNRVNWNFHSFASCSAQIKFISWVQPKPSRNNNNGRSASLTRCISYSLTTYSLDAAVVGHIWKISIYFSCKSNGDAFAFSFLILFN